MRRVARELAEFRDPVNGRQVVETAPATHAPPGPDMIVGYGRGDRGSWEAALGAGPRGSLEDNDDRRSVVWCSELVATAPATRAPPGPDMIVGYGRGYRGSWETALGAVPRAILEDNTDVWIGDHCINAEDVPGVLLSNRAVRAERPSLRDVTVTILGMFGVGAGEGMKGRSVFLGTL